MVKISYQEVIRKRIVNKGDSVATLSLHLLHGIRSSRDLVIHLFQLQKDTLTNGNFPYKYKMFLLKGNSYLVFLTLPCELFLRKIKTKTKQ